MPALSRPFLPQIKEQSSCDRLLGHRTWADGPGTGSCKLLDLQTRAEGTRIHSTSENRETAWATKCATCGALGPVGPLSIETLCSMNLQRTGQEPPGPSIFKSSRHFLLTDEILQ